MMPFSFAATPHIHFGIGKRSMLSTILKSFGSKVLLISGAKSFDDAPLCQELWQLLSVDFALYHERVDGEPSPQMVDDWVLKYQAVSPDVVVAVGGGSAVDAAKAVAGLLPTGDTVMDYLEGVGKGKTFISDVTPFVAVPTTAGTGGETSKNAVLSVVSATGYKKSFRHESLVAKHIVLDPELTVSCTPAITAACGMDAFTQLLESYVSTKASPMTDALAWSGLERVSSALLSAYDDGRNLEARADMLYASSISGLTLANAGLGSVHGLASPLGAYFPVAHGVVCGTLLFEATYLNIEVMLEKEPLNPALLKYAKVGRLLAHNDSLDDASARLTLLATLKFWQDYLQMPKLGGYGVTAADFRHIIANVSGGSMATNPVVLSDEDLMGLLGKRA